jgi:hypothetical protein
MVLYRRQQGSELDAKSALRGSVLPANLQGGGSTGDRIGASQRANEINNIRSGAPTALAGKVFIRLGARGGIGNLPLGIDGNVQARVRTPIAEVCPAVAVNPIPHWSPPLMGR